MNNQPVFQPSLKPVGIAPIEKFFLMVGFLAATVEGVLWRDPVLVLLTLILAVAVTVLFAVWRVASYMVGMLADLAPAFRKMKQVGLLG